MFEIMVSLNSPSYLSHHSHHVSQTFQTVSFFLSWIQAPFNSSPSIIKDKTYFWKDSQNFKNVFALILIRIFLLLLGEIIWKIKKINYSNYLILLTTFF